MRTILFVCTGNTCRSIMAEGILKNMLKSRGIDENKIKAESAGIAAFPGQTATQQAIYVMKQRGIDISGHSARQLDKDILDNAALVLTMTQNHKHMILHRYPETADKVFTIKEYAYRGKEGFIDITDPYGQSVEVYERTAEEIRKGLKEIIDNEQFTNYN